jgi:hypothetical protein
MTDFQEGRSMTSTANRRYPRIEGESEEEAAASLAAEFEDEDEFEDESEYEDEAFLGGIAKALGGLLGESEDEEEAEYEFEFEAEAETEAEMEGEFEDEAFVNPIRRIYPDAELMAHLSSQAARAEGEDEAEAFIGALIPLAARLIPRAAALIHRNAPTLIRGATRLAGQLRRQPRGRRLVTTLPVVLQRTAQSLSDQAAAGHAITPATALDTLGTIAQGVLSDPADCRRVMSAVGTFDRRYHRRHQGRPSSWAGGQTTQPRPRTAGGTPQRRYSSSSARRARRRR